MIVEMIGDEDVETSYRRKASRHGRFDADACGDVGAGRHETVVHGGFDVVDRRGEIGQKRRRHRVFDERRFERRGMRDERSCGGDEFRGSRRSRQRKPSGDASAVEYEHARRAADRREPVK
jgi:hypothetical protein